MSIHKDPHISVEDFNIVKTYIQNKSKTHPLYQRAYQISSKYNIEHDKTNLYVNDKILIPDDVTLRNKTIHSVWQGFPAGRDKLYDIIQQDYYGISRRDVAAYLQMNTTHQQFQIPKRPKVVRPIITTRPFSHIEIDLGDIDYIIREKVGKSKKNKPYTLCILQDHFTKYMQCYVILTHTMADTSKCLKAYITHVKEKFNAKPEIIHSDNGKEFVGQDFQAMCKKLKLQFITGRSYKPSTQGLIERAMKTIKSYISRLKEDGEIIYLQDLPKIVDTLILNYNNSKHSTTNVRPVDAAKGTENTYVYNRIVEKAKKMVKPDRIILTPGDEVRISLLKNDDYQHIGTREGHTQRHYIYFPMWSQETYFIVERKKTIYDTYIYYLAKREIFRPKRKRRGTSQNIQAVQYSYTNLQREFYLHQLQRVIE